MENSEETHYVSFLSGEGGGMGGGNSRYRRARPSVSPSYVSRSIKRSVLGLRLKAQLLVAAILASLFLCCFFFFWVARETKNNAADDAADVFTPKEEDTGDISDNSNNMNIPDKVYDWEDKHFAIAFNQFMSEHGKSYNSLKEKERRFRIFKANLTHILLHNEQGHSFELGMNKFGDWTREEFQSFVKNGFRPNPHSLQYSRLGASPLTDPHNDSADLSGSSSSGSSSSSGAPLPASVDWRDKGCVTPPKDQGQCGSCWAFSATGAVEGAWCIKKGTLINLSEQMLMDCSRYLGNNSCNGGLMDDAFSYITQKGLCSERDYPYEAKDGKCREKRCKPQIKIKGFYDVPPGDEAAMRAALALHGPVSIAIQADQIDFQFYKKGVFEAPCGSNLDHGVLLVGYGTDENTKKDFFIMKNSWGKGWGENGFMRMAQHKGKEGECGLLLSGSYPLVDGEDPPTP